MSSALRLHEEPDLSNDAITWAFGLNIPTTRKFVLVALADHANLVSGLSFCGKAKLVNKTGYAERTVQQALTDLEEVDRVISTTNRKGGRPVEARARRPHIDFICRRKRHLTARRHLTAEKEASHDKQESISRQTRGHLTVCI